MTDGGFRLPDPVVARLGDVLQAGYEYWLAIAPGPGLLPGRRHLDPVDIPDLLPFVILYDFYGSPRVYRFRLMGTRVVESIGRDLTGSSLDTALGEKPLEEARARMDRVVELRRPDWRLGAPIIRAGERHNTMQRLFLPLAENGHDVDMLLCLVQYYSAAGGGGGGGGGGRRPVMAEESWPPP